MNLFYLVEDIEWSPWKSCIQSDSNLCRYQVRPCHNKQSSSCEDGYEFRLENCTGEQVLWRGGGGGGGSSQKNRVGMRFPLLAAQNQVFVFQNVLISQNLYPVVVSFRNSKIPDTKIFRNIIEHPISM